MLGIPVFTGDGVQGFFDRIARVYESRLWYSTAVGLTSGFTLSGEELVDAVTSKVDAEKVLDVGCGTGKFTRRLARKADRVVGVDVSIGMLRRARRYALRDGVEPGYLRADAARLPFPDESFDHVVCAGAFHLFPDKKRALGEIERVLEPGGGLTLTTLVDRWLAGNAVVQRFLALLGIHVFAPDELRELVRDAGFGEPRVETMGSFVLLEAKV